MIDKLFENAAAGRGFWAGLFPADPGYTETHTTLAHFGRSVSAAQVERVLTACRRTLDPTPGPLAARSWATARMDQKAGSVIALLLESPALLEFRQALLQHCGACGVRVDDRFGYHPHVTLRRLPRSEPAEFTAADRVDLRFEALSLVCGEARLDLDLRTVVAADPDQISMPF
jgi:2'-5' RNA ligase